MIKYEGHIYSESDLAGMDGADYEEICACGEELDELPPGWESNTMGGYRKIKLTETEQQIAELISTQGLTNAEVAEIIGVGKRTVDTHLRNIYTKLKLRNRAELIIWYRDMGRKAIRQAESSK